MEEFTKDELVKELYHIVNDIEYLTNLQLSNEYAEDIQELVNKKKKIEKTLIKMFK